MLLYTLLSSSFVGWLFVVAPPVERSQRLLAALILLSLFAVIYYSIKVRLMALASATYPSVVMMTAFELGDAMSCVGCVETRRSAASLSNQRIHYAFAHGRRSAADVRCLVSTGERIAIRRVACQRQLPDRRVVVVQRVADRRRCDFSTYNFRSFQSFKFVKCEINQEV